MSDFSLHGKTVIVTGGAGGLGRAMVAAYAEAGAQTLIVRFASYEPERQLDTFLDKVAPFID